jgi:hypothetical protein
MLRAIYWPFYKSPPSVNLHMGGDWLAPHVPFLSPLSSSGMWKRTCVCCLECVHVAKPPCMGSCHLLTLPVCFWDRWCSQQSGAVSWLAPLPLLVFHLLLTLVSPLCFYFCIMLHTELGVGVYKSLLQRICASRSDFFPNCLLVCFSLYLDKSQ